MSGTALRGPAALTFAGCLAVTLMAVSGVFLDNPGAIPLSEAGRAVLVLTVLSAVLVAVAFAVPALRAAAPVLPVALFALFKFHVLLAFAAAVGLKYYGAMAAGFAVIALLTWAAAGIVRQYPPAAAARVIATVAILPAAVSMTLVALDLARDTSDLDAVVARTVPPAPEIRADAPPLPDIIYIVPDRYAAAAKLGASFGADNRPFVDGLRARGFTVADDARANYFKTFQSLASTLNMAPLDPVIAALGPDQPSQRPIFEMLEDNAVQRTLRGYGYAYHHLGNWWQPVQTNVHADVNFYGAGWGGLILNEFEQTLLRTTPLLPLVFDVAPGSTIECRRLQNQLDYLKRVRTDPDRTDRPLFVFAHLTMPHDPIVMTRDGACRKPLRYPAPGVTWEAFKAAYTDYLGYLNEQLLAIFDANRASTRGLVFVIQSDEGPYPLRYREDQAMDLFALDADELRLKYGILNALYWDPGVYGPPTLTDTPVNNWRIILSAITGAPMPLIADERSYLFRSEARPYDMRDVTEELTAPRLAASDRAGD